MRWVGQAGPVWRESSVRAFDRDARILKTKSLHPFPIHSRFVLSMDDAGRLQVVLTAAFHGGAHRKRCVRPLGAGDLVN